jgi:hypothetical protein
MANVNEALPESLGIDLREKQQINNDPHFRWNGERTDGPKTGEAGAQVRRAAFETIEQFQAWRKDHGFPDLSPADLKRSFDMFRGNPVYEQALAKPIKERR